MIVEKATTQRLNLYYDLYVPDEETHSRPLPLLIALHGYEGNKESMMARARAINDQDFVIASLQGPDSFFVRGTEQTDKPKIGFGWMMQYKAEDTIRLHHETLLALIDQTAREFPIDTAKLFLLGFSQSVSLNYRFAFTHAGLVRGVIAVCGGIPGDWDRDKYRNSDTDVLILSGEDDEFYPLARTRTFKDAIGRRAASVTYHSFHGGHAFPRDLDAIIGNWLTTRLGTENRII